MRPPGLASWRAAPGRAWEIPPRRSGPISPRPPAGSVAELGLDADADESRRLEALFVLSITLGLGHPGHPAAHRPCRCRLFIRAGQAAWACDVVSCWPVSAEEAAVRLISFQRF